MSDAQGDEAPPAAQSAYQQALLDLDSIAQAGDAAAADTPLKALQHLRSTEGALFTPIPDQYVLHPKKASKEPIVPNPDKYGIVASPKKKNNPLVHPGQALCDTGKPLATEWKKGAKPAAHYAVSSRYTSLFSALSEEAPAPMEIHAKGDRRKELEERRQKRLEGFIPPAKPGATKAALRPLPQKETKKVSSVFVPACAAAPPLADDCRRREVDRAKEEASRKKVSAAGFK